MASIYSENQSSHLLLWSKNHSPWATLTPFTDSSYDPSADTFYFCPDRISSSEKRFFFSFYEYSHSIEFIEIPSAYGYSFKIKISPIIPTIFANPPEYNFKVQDYVIGSDLLSAAISSAPQVPGDVIINNNYTSEIKLLGTFNGNELNRKIVGSNNIGTLASNESLEFEIQFCNNLDAIKPCKVEISIEDINPKLTFHVMKYTYLVLSKIGAPGNINLTIEPDNP